MDRQAFKNRMQKLKSYRESNPGKGYWDWRDNLPDNLKYTDDTEYDMEAAYDSGAQPEYVEEDNLYHLPTRDPDTGKIFKKSIHSTFWKGLTEDMKLGYKPYFIGDDVYTKNKQEAPIQAFVYGGETDSKIIDTLDSSRVKDSKGISLKQTIENLHNKFPNEPESNLKPFIDNEKEWYDYLITEGSGYVDAGQIPEVTIKPDQIYTYLDTYYPVTNEQYKYTGHSKLSHDGLCIDKGGKNKGYNLVTNNCADATIGALQSISGKKANPFLFTTPGDVRDFALEELSGEVVWDRKGQTRVRIPINATQSKKLREYIISGKAQREFADGGEVGNFNDDIYKY